MNTNFMEERVVETREAYPATKLSIPKSIESEMADGTWMAKNQLLKPVQVGQFTWSSTLPRGTNVGTIDYPEVLGNNESLVLRTLRMYAFYKLSPCFRIQINATVFHQGQLICAFDPFSYCDTPSVADYEYSHIYATGLPNVKIMASHSDAVELKLPFVHPRSYLTTNTTQAYNNLGTLNITVLNPLVAAEGASPSLTVTVWAYAENAEVHVPIQDHDPILTFEAPIELVETSFYENLSSVVGQSTDIIGNLVSGNVGQALRKGQGLIDTLGTIFGFDYPARTLQPSKTISPIENLAIAKGVSQSQRLAIDPFSMQSLQDDVAAESLESMNLKRIAQMPMLLTQFVFNGTQSPGTVLKSIPINPCISPRINGGLQRTFLSYVSNGFLYWSGGIVYDIEIVATKFHSGKLIFAYVPNSQETPSYSAVSDSLPNVIVDIQQTSSMKFMVPFTSSTSMKSTYTPTDDATSLNFVDSCTGTLVCYVQNVLAYASNVSASIEINVYVSAAEDFSLYVPQRPVFNRVGPNLQETSILLNTNKNENPTTSVSLSLGRGISVARHHFGEDYSLLDLIKRFSPASTQIFTLDGENTSQSLAIPLTPTLFSITNTTSSSYLAYWSKLYNCWSGSLRYKFMLRANKNTTVAMHAVHIPTLSSASIPQFDQEQVYSTDFAFGGFGMVRTQVMQDCALEIELPYYSRYNMLFTSYSLATIFAPILSDMYYNGLVSLTLSCDPDAESQGTFSVDCFVAAGDDFRLIYLRAPPFDLTNTILSIDTL